MVVTPEHTGILVWFIWALIGVAAALITQRIAAQPGMLVFNIIVGIAGALIGGFLSVQFVGDFGIFKGPAKEREGAAPYLYLYGNGY